MAANWFEKIQQDADLQMFLGLAGGGLVLFVVLLIIIVARLKNRKKKQAEKPLGDIRVQSTHTPDVLEKAKEHVVFRNKVANQDLSHLKPESEPPVTPDPINPTPTTPEIPPVVPEPPVHVPKVPPEIMPESGIVPSPPTPTVVPTSAFEAFDEEEKKKEILKAIEQTRSREENLRILNERLRELRGESITVETTPAPEIKPEEAEQKPLEENNVVESLQPTVVVQPESAESVAEYSEPMEVDRVDDDTTEETPFVQETVLPVSKPEETISVFSAKPEADSPKTFTEWLTALSGKKR